MGKPSTGDPRTYAEALVKERSIALTGIYDLGTELTLVGVQTKVNGGVTLQYKCTTALPPLRRKVEAVKLFDDLWNKLGAAMGSIPFYSKLSIEQRLEHVDSNAKDVEGNLDDDKMAEIQLLACGNPGTHLVKELSTDTLTDLQTCGWMPPQRIADAFGRKTLFFLQPFWSIRLHRPYVETFTGVVVDATDAAVTVTEQKLMKADATKMWLVPVPHFHPCAIAIPPSAVTFGPDLVWKACAEALGDDAKQDAWTRSKTHMIALSGLKAEDGRALVTPAFWKSMLQKLIRWPSVRRFLPPVTAIPGHEYDSRFVLVCSMALLALHPGAFIPDVQRFVTGIEGLVKRLAVICWEDSYATGDDLLHLMACAVVAKQLKTWRPSYPFLVRWFRIGLAAMASTKCFVYDLSSKTPVPTGGVLPCDSSWQNAAALLAIVRSFDGDIRLAHAVAAHQGTKLLESKGPPTSCLSWTHALDQHCAPNMAYLELLSVLQSCGGGSGGHPFASYFGSVFRHVTGFNPRRGRSDAEVCLPKFDANVKRTQDAYWKACTGPSIEGTKSNIKTDLVEYEVKYVLKNEWLAAAIGHLELRKMKPAAYAVVHPTDLSINLTKKPARGKSVTTTDSGGGLTEVQHAKLTSGVDTLLSQGVKWRGCDPPLDAWKNAIITRNGAGTFFINGEPWDTARHVSCKTQIDSKAWDLLQVKLEQAASKTLTKTDPNPLFVVKRLLSYLQQYGRTLELPGIARDGGGTAGMVYVQDSGVVEWLVSLCTWFPHALGRIGPVRFRVLLPPLVWIIRDRIADMLVRTTTTTTAVIGPPLASSSSSSKWSKGAFQDTIRTRVDWPHQKDLIAQMMDRHRQGYTRHFVWLHMGLGKTRILLRFLFELLVIGALPPYFILSTPHSAMATVRNECKAFGLAVYELRKRAGGNGVVTKPLPYTVTLVEHDQLRQVKDILLPIVDRAVVAIDEVHKALDETTQRTAACQLLVDQAAFGLITTGTPVVDNSLAKMIRWLQTTVQFQVTLNNFMVATLVMLHKRVRTGIEIRSRLVTAAMTDAGRQVFQDNMPASRGGNRKSADHKATQTALAVCRASVTRQIVKEAVALLSDRKTCPGVFILAESSAHQETLKSDLVKAGAVNEKEICLVSGKHESVDLTPLNAKTVMPDVRVLIGSLHHVNGYNATRFHHMISGVYPSNQATRDQAEGRCDRIGQVSPFVEIIKVVDAMGVGTWMLNAHAYPKSVNEMLAQLVVPSSSSSSSSASSSRKSSVPTKKRKRSDDDDDDDDSAVRPSRSKRPSIQ